MRFYSRHPDRSGFAFILSEDAAVTAAAHEIGHNLGLDHVLPDDGTNLMNPTTFTFNPASLPALTSGQISDILSSLLVQTDLGGQKYIQITPFLVEGDQVPEPSTIVLVSCGTGFAVWNKRRSSAA